MIAKPHSPHDQELNETRRGHILDTGRTPMTSSSALPLRSAFPATLEAGDAIASCRIERRAAIRGEPDILVDISGQRYDAAAKRSSSTRVGVSSTTMKRSRPR